jgi:hypothetical protein
MPPVTTTYSVKLLGADASVAGTGTLSFGSAQSGSVTVTFSSESSKIPSATGSGTLSKCGDITTLQVLPTTTSLFSLQASVYAVGAGKASAAGIGGGIAVASLAQGQAFAGALIGVAYPTEEGAGSVE